MRPQVLAWIERQKPSLVNAAESYVGKHRGRVTTSSQLRSLLATALDEPLAVTKSYLKYQIGRGKKGWGIHQSSGEAMGRLLQTEVADRIRDDEIFSPESAGEQIAIERRLGGLLVGYVIREHTYREKVKRGGSRRSNKEKQG